jgi:hypothetical protein
MRSARFLVERVRYRHAAGTRTPAGPLRHRCPEIAYSLRSERIASAPPCRTARSLIDRALDDPSVARLERARLLPARVEIEIACNMVEAARAASDQLAAIASLCESSALMAGAALARGMVELAEQKAADAAAGLRRARKLWTEIQLPYEAARSRVLLAQAYEALGNHEEATLELDAAGVAFERLGARADLRKVAELRGRREEG